MTEQDDTAARWAQMVSAETAGSQRIGLAIIAGQLNEPSTLRRIADALEDANRKALQ